MKKKKYKTFFFQEFESYEILFRDLNLLIGNCLNLCTNMQENELQIPFGFASVANYSRKNAVSNESAIACKSNSSANSETEFSSMNAKQGGKYEN